MKGAKSGPITLANRRTGEIWICESWATRRLVDGVEFVEVHRPQQTRAVWMNLETLERVKKTNHNNSR